jgi:hypothetical protein
MGIDAFVLRYQLEGQQFADEFLASKDFDIETLKTIARDLNTPANQGRNRLVDLISLRASQDEFARRKVIEHLSGRKKGWLSLKAGRVTRFPNCSDPQELVIREGKEEWYGPVTCTSDVAEARWYIRPVLIEHWEKLESDDRPRKVQIRWLCFARVVSRVISLHWRGFSYAQNPDEATHSNSQFPYWEHIPQLFEEIEELTRAKVSHINLHNLVLYELWDEYRGNPVVYKWLDRRIRAESSGVSLSAHAGAVHDIDTGGIRHLASTIRKSIESELATRHRYKLPDPARFDETILRTLIREYGALSYGFSLEKGEEVIFQAHCYFGLKEQAQSPDSFPHFNLQVTKCHDLRQLEFLLNHLGKGKSSYESYKPETLPLFQQR